MNKFNIFLKNYFCLHLCYKHNNKSNIKWHSCLEKSKKHRNALITKNSNIMENIVFTVALSLSIGWISQLP